MKITRKQLRNLIKESITEFQCLNNSAGYIEPNGSVHILPQERIGGSRLPGRRISFKRAAMSHKMYLKERGIKKEDTKGWLYVSNISDINLINFEWVASSYEDYLKAITPQQWNAFFKEFFDPCIEAWNRKNKGREYKLFVGMNPYTLEKLFQNKHVASSLT